MTTPSCLALWAQVRSSVARPFRLLAGASEAEAISPGEGADLLTTDFSMPENNGVALIEDLQAKKRSSPAILITGCAAQCAIRFDTASFLSFNKLISWSELQEAITISLRTSNST